MAKSITRTVIVKIYHVKAIDVETEQIRAFDIKCLDMKPAQTLKVIKENLSEHEVLLTNELIDEKKVTYIMPAARFYAGASVKE